MANNQDVNNNTALVPYREDINEYLLRLIHSNEVLTGLENFEKNVRKAAEDHTKLCSLIKNNKIFLETQLKIQNKESLLAALESYKSRNLELKKQLLLAKEQKAYVDEERNETSKKYKEKWLRSKNLFENIPFIKGFVEKTREIETIKRGINSITNEVEKIRSDSILKKTELLNMRNKYIVELADYMINKKAFISKSIQEATNGIKKLKNEKQINNPVMKNKFPASGSTKLAIEAKISSEDTVSTSRNSKARNTFVLPQLRLTAHTDAAPINFDQKINCNNTAKARKRPFESFITKKFHELKKKKTTEKIDEHKVSTYLLRTNRTMDGNNTRKYPDDKIIRVLEDIKLDRTGTYKIVSQLKPNHLQDVNVIKAKESQHDLKTKDLPQENVNEKIIEDIEILDLTKKMSQDVILPPTQFLDFTLSPQEKRVTFNGVITIEDLPNLVTNDTTPQDDNVINNPPNSQLNASTASDDSYKKIKDFVFKKHNVNLSPEFTYTKNVVVPMVAENKIVTSKFFDEKESGNNNIDSSKIQDIEIVEIVDEEPQIKQIQEIRAETVNEVNTTSDNIFEPQECLQKDDAPSAAPSFANCIRDTSCSLNISMNKTGYEDDGEFLHCIVDSSLLLSPKADDEMQTNNNKVETQPREVPSFLSGFKRTGFSLFGTNEADAQNQNDNFNINFGGNEKTKKGGFFTMFH